MTTKEPAIGWEETLGQHANMPEQSRQLGFEIEALGEKWRVATAENLIKAHFENWVKNAARKELLEMNTGANQEESKNNTAAYLGSQSSYRWDGRFIREALQDLPGIQHYLYLILRRCHKDMTPDMAAEIWEDNPAGCGKAVAWSLGNSKSPAKKPGRTATVNQPAEDEETMD